MDDEAEKIPVYVCAPGEEKDNPSIGAASSKAEAAKLIRAETGDAAFRSRDVYYSPHRNAYYSEEG